MAQTTRPAVEAFQDSLWVLFADIKGWLELIRGSDPERVQAPLHSAIGAAADGLLHGECGVTSAYCVILVAKRRALP